MKKCFSKTLALEIGAGLLCAAAAGALGVAFWPQVKPDRISARPLVEQPEFVAAASALRVPPPTLVATPSPSTSATAPLTPDIPKAALSSLARSVVFAPRHEAAPSPEPALDASAPASPGAAETCARGLVALADGELAAARRWLERAADLGDKRALLALGDAYNPTMLKKLGVVGAPGEPARARDYYNRARASGLAIARERLTTLEANAN